jgi:hypothetical protein
VRGIVVDNRREPREHTFKILQNVVVPKADDREALTAEPIVSHAVGSCARMLSAVNLNDNPHFE